MSSITQPPPNLVTLDCGPDDFKRFIQSLLGKPQTITNHFEGEFDLKREDLEQFHFLLMHRISEQNRASLIQFTARIVYNDDSTVLVNDFDVFKTYNEPKPLRSIAVHLSWEFLVNFEDRKTPEKQEIDISVITGRSRPIMDNNHTWFIAPFSSTPGMIAFRISHTARSWASDIEALISGHIRTVLKDKSRIRTWLSNNDSAIGITIFCLLVLAAVITVFVVGQSLHGEQMKEASSIHALTSIEPKIDRLATMAAEGLWPRFTVYGMAFLGSMVLSALGLSIWASTMADARAPAFVTLTRKGEEFRKRMLDRSRNRFLLFILSVLVSIAVGIAGNWIFAYFVQGWRPQ